MFYKISFLSEEVNCNCNYEELKEKLSKIINGDKNKIKNIEMECRRIITGGILEFNFNAASLLLSITAFFLSIYGNEKIPFSLIAFVAYIAVLAFVVGSSINLHMKKQNAEKVLFVIEDIKKEL